MRKILVSTILGVGIAGTANASIVSSGFLDEKLTEYALSTSLDLKANQSDLTALSNKIGTLPSAILPSMWTNVPYYSENNVNMPDAGFPLPPTLGEQLEFLFNGGPESPIERMFWTITMRGGNVNANDDPGADFLGLHPLTQKVRSIEENITLPSGEIGGYGPLVAEMLQHNFYQYPKDLAGIYDVLFGTEENMGVLERFATSTLSGVPNSFSGLYSIGTLPSGNFPEFPFHESLSDIGQPLTYPTSLAELITAIYGNSETDSKGLLAAIITGFPADADGDGQYESNAGLMPNLELATTASDIARANATKINANTAKIGTVPDGKNLAGMISETDAKIGTLPTEYATVGAALTAIKGIAEDAKAAALAAIPDPKTEGSTGKFVLTVDIVGDNATYRWEKIDREGETTTTTE